jgi:hypothetical protein
MDTTKLLATSAIVMLMAATIPSLAQQEGAPQRERPAPAEKIAPHNAPRAGEAPQNRGRAETTGQAPRDERQGRPSEQKSQQKQGRTGQEHRSGRAPREDRPSGASERDRKTDQVQGGGGNPETTGQAAQEKDRSRVEGSRETTGQGAAAARTHNLTPQTRTRIHEIVVRERNAPRVNNPDFEVSVGARVPRSARFVALPPTIVEIQPEWRGFEYFMIGDQMVIVNPRTMEIMAIVDA